jgi:hypothetical protein
MHDKKELDSLVQDNKELLALESGSDKQQIESDKFVEDYKEISDMINELVDEVLLV